MSEQRKTSHNVISVRFSDEELERVKALSARTGTPVSSLIRKAALDERSVTGAAVITYRSPNGMSGHSTQASYVAGRLDLPMPATARAVTATYTNGRLLQH